MPPPRYRTLALLVGFLAAMLVVPPALGWEPESGGPVAEVPAEQPGGDSAGTWQGSEPKDDDQSPPTAQADPDQPTEAPAANGDQSPPTAQAGASQPAGGPAPGGAPDSDADVGLMELGGGAPAAPPAAADNERGKDDDIGLMDFPSNQPPAATGGPASGSAATEAGPLKVPDPDAKPVDPEVDDALAQLQDLRERLDGPMSVEELDELITEIGGLMENVEWKGIGSVGEPIDIDALSAFWGLAALEREARMTRAAAQAPAATAGAPSSMPSEITAIGSQLESWEGRRVDPPPVEQWHGLVEVIGNLKEAIEKDALSYQDGDDWDAREQRVDPVVLGQWSTLRRYQQRAQAAAAKAEAQATQPRGQDAVAPTTLTDGPEAVTQLFPDGHSQQLANELVQQGLQDWSPLPQQPLVTPPHAVNLRGLGLGNGIGPPHPPQLTQPDGLGQIPPFSLQPPPETLGPALQVAAGALGVWALTQVVTALPCLPAAPPVGYLVCLVSPIP